MSWSARVFQIEALEAPITQQIIPGKRSNRKSSSRLPGVFAADKMPFWFMNDANNLKNSIIGNNLPVASPVEMSRETRENSK